MEIYEFNPGAQGPLVHLAHANGMPPETYRAALEPLLERFRVVATYARPLRAGAPAPSALAGWDELTDELAEALVGLGGPMIGIGHSMGGVSTLRVAARRPELFSKLVLLDPTLLAGKRLWLLRLAHLLAIEHLGNPMKSTLTRTNRWESRARALESFRRNPLFEKFTDEALAAYVEHGLVERGGPGSGVELRYSREWEARIYQTTPTGVWREKFPASIPTLVVRGGRSRVFTRESERAFLARQPDARVEVVDDAGHVLAHERPREVARLIAEFVSSAAAARPRRARALRR